jgi:oxygen-independent coproporphyrinogen III oxidase
MLPQSDTSLLKWDSELIGRYDLAGPRYTSYPTAPQFSDTFSLDDFHAAVERSNARQRPLSLYFHIPFCDTLCFYCGCNKIVTNTKSRAEPYLQMMQKEMRFQSRLFDQERVVKQLHWGGGTPTFISDNEMTALMSTTRQCFTLLDDDSGEYSIEIHPGRVSAKTMGHLRQLGFNRVSMGIQDFDPKVQKAVNRYNTVEDVNALVKSLRLQKYHSISMDLIYGLPLQTPAGFSLTLEHVIDLSPDRLSLFNYAHLPQLFKSQSLIKEEELPSAQDKLEILHMSIELLQQAGYVYVGMDHFAKPNDTLVTAQRSGKLQRNFQGYSTHGDCDLLAFGVSSISDFGGVYIQNAKKIDQYQQLIKNDLLAIEKGFTLRKEDHLRKYVINQLICHFHLNFTSLKTLFDIDPQVYFKKELSTLTPMINDNLLSVDAHGINIEEVGRLLIRRICMVFDEYLNDKNVVRYSKVI